MLVLVHLECRFNVTAVTTVTSTNGTRTGIHSGVIRNTDVPDKLLAYSKDFNVSIECIWNITVMPGWKVSKWLLLCGESWPFHCVAAATKEVL